MLTLEYPGQSWEQRGVPRCRANISVAEALRLLTGHSIVPQARLPRRMHHSHSLSTTVSRSVSDMLSVPPLRPEKKLARRPGPSS